MNLVFFDRTASTPAPAGVPVLSLRRDGNFTLSGAAVVTHGLAEHRWVRLAQDTDTGAWFLVFGGPAGTRPFSLRTAKGKGGLVRCWSSAATAKQLCKTFGLSETEATLRLLVHAPLAHEAGALYPLLPQGAAVPAPVEAAAPDAAAPEAVTIPADSMTIAPEPAAPVQPAPVAAPKFSAAALPESRAEQLADYWYEREISKAEPSELSELLKVLGNTPKGDRGFKENVVLGRAKAENARRGKGKGGNRG